MIINLIWRKHMQMCGEKGKKTSLSYYQYWVLRSDSTEAHAISGTYMYLVSRM